MEKPINVIRVGQRLLVQLIDYPTVEFELNHRIPRKPIIEISLEDHRNSQLHLPETLPLSMQFDILRKENSSKPHRHVNYRKSIYKWMVNRKIFTLKIHILRIRHLSTLI